MQEDNIVVSVIMPVYNHEEYVAKAIESVIKQQVNFKYELIIGEDCSTDNSLNICRMYEQLYPNIILLLRHEQNLGPVDNMYDLSLRARGTFVIMLEGDDFWCDSFKLVKQVDFLRTNKNYIACCHKFSIVNKEEIEYFDRDFKIQFWEKNPYTLKEYENGFLPSHLNTLMYRNIFLDVNIDTSFLNMFNNMAWDATLSAILILHGNIYCLNQVMSCYRRVVDVKSSSFSSMQEYKNKRDLLFESQIYLENKFKKQIDFKQRKKNIFASAIFKWYREKNMKNFRVVCKIINLSQQKVIYISWFLYLIFIKTFYYIIGKKDHRVKF